MTLTPDITFVCCIESGPLETQTIRMIESLRRWGGRFANAPMLAVTPRLGSPLSGETKAALTRLNVEHLRFQADNPYSWKSFLNKHYALMAAEKHATSEFIGWLDSDVLIVDEPDQFMLKEGEDIVACPSDKNIGITGPGDKFYDYWQAACSVVGIEVEDLPWIVTKRDKTQIRLHFNGGIQVHRRSVGFAPSNLDATLRFFDARIAPRALKKIYFTQHLLGMVIVERGLSWRALPYSHNYSMGSKTYDRWYKKEQLQEAKVVHYHDSMWPWFWPTLIKSLRETHQEVANWLEPLGPLENKVPLPWRLYNKVLEKNRARQEKIYTQSCQRV